MDPTHPIFSFLTHLEVIGFLTDTEFQALSSKLALLPALTHVALVGITNTTVPAAMLSTNMKLKVLVCLEWIGSCELSFEDVRLVCLPVPEEYEHDWITGVNGGLDFWTRAELFVGKKRRGEIKPSSPLLVFHDHAAADVRI
jgi:hypothetical protein